MRMLGKVKEKGYSIVPLKMYFKDSLVKVEVALVKGKRNYDKKETIMRKDAETRRPAFDKGVFRKTLILPLFVL